MKTLGLAVAALSLTTAWSAQANDVRTVAPALEKYTPGRLLGEVWKRPGLSPRDRSIVTLTGLIARNQTIEMPHYLNVALDNGVKPAEISEVITHLAFYSGLGNAMSAVAVTKEVFAKRGIRADQLAPVSPKLLAFDEKSERIARSASDSSSAPWRPESCSTPPTSCSSTCGCARTSRPGIAAWSRSAC